MLTSEIETPGIGHAAPGPTYPADLTAEVDCWLASCKPRHLQRVVKAPLSEWCSEEFCQEDGRRCLIGIAEDYTAAGPRDPTGAPVTDEEAAALAFDELAWDWGLSRAVAGVKNLAMARLAERGEVSP